MEAGQVLASLDREALELEVIEAESNYLTQTSMGDLFASLFSDLESLFGAVNASLGLADYYRATLAEAAVDYREEIEILAP